MGLHVKFHPQIYFKPIIECTKSAIFNTVEVQPHIKGRLYENLPPSSLLMVKCNTAFTGTWQDGRHFFGFVFVKATRRRARKVVWLIIKQKIIPIPARISHWRSFRAIRVLFVMIGVHGSSIFMNKPSHGTGLKRWNSFHRWLTTRKYYGVFFISTSKRYNLALVCEVQQWLIWLLQTRGMNVLIYLAR